MIGRIALLLLCNAALLQAQQSVALVDINVIPMDSARVLPAQTVIIDRGRIVSIGPSETATVPDGARIIDGKDKYLLPSLADMHVHLRGDSTELLLYLANGVTVVRDMASEPIYLQWRDAIAAGAMVGPRLYVTSPLIDAPTGKRVLAWLGGGAFVLAAAVCMLLWLMLRKIEDERMRRLLAWATPPAMIAAAYLVMRTVVPFPAAIIPESGLPRLWVGSAAEAARAVRHAANQYDQIKLYDGALSKAQFDAAVRAAQSIGVHTVGHAPPSLGLQHAVQAGLSELAHIYFIVQDLQVNADTGNRTIESAYRERLARIVEDMRRAGVLITSTLMPLPEVRQRFTDSAAFFARDDHKYRTPTARRVIRDQIRAGPEPALLADLQTHITWGSIAAAELVRAGIPLALGTDTSPRDVVAGFAVHTELDMLVESGMTPYQAIRTATVNAGQLMDAAREWGTIAVGMRADLMVVNRNPLDDVTALRRPLGVLASGRWYDRAALDGFLATVEQRRAGS